MKKVALFIENMFDERELIYPYYRMQEEGYTVDLIGTDEKTVYHGKNGVPFKSDKASKDISADDYDALIIPGGFSPDYMRRNQPTLDFARDMDNQNKPIAAICHGPWIMVSSCGIKGRKMTGYPSIKDDIEHAGATYVDEEVVKDGNLITSRNPNDLPAFAKTIIQALK